jgi:hypothetical protein
MGAEAAVGGTDSAAEDLPVMDLVGEVLSVMVLERPTQVSVGAALVRDSAGRVDLRVEGFLVGQISVASVSTVSVGEIVGFANSTETLSILASMALDSRELLIGAEYWRE